MEKYIRDDEYMILKMEKTIVDLTRSTYKIENYDLRDEIQEHIINIIDILEDTINAPYDWRLIKEHILNNSEYEDIRQNIDIY